MRGLRGRAEGPKAVTPMSDELLRCRCGSAEVSLTETTTEHHWWDDGLRVVDGVIRPVGMAHHSDGDILSEKTRIECGACGRNWRPRRLVGVPYDPEETHR